MSWLVVRCVQPSGNRWTCAGHPCGDSSLEGEGGGQQRGALKEDRGPSWGRVGAHDEAVRAAAPACQGEEQSLLSSYGGVDMAAGLRSLHTGM